jgi:hypothetical protein
VALIKYCPNFGPLVKLKFDNFKSLNIEIKKTKTLRSLYRTRNLIEDVFRREKSSERKINKCII